MPLVHCINTSTIGKFRSRVPSLVQLNRKPTTAPSLVQLNRKPFLAIQLQTALSHTAAALHAATRCKTSSPVRSKKTRARQQHRPRQRAESSHAAAPRKKTHRAQQQHRARQRAESHAAPRAEKKSCGSSAHSSAPTHMALSQQFFAPPSPLVESVLRPCVQTVSSWVPMLDVMVKGTSYRPCPGSLRSLAPREAYTVPGREVILHTTTLRGKLFLCAHILCVGCRDTSQLVWVQAYLCPCTTPCTTPPRKDGRASAARHEYVY